MLITCDGADWLGPVIAAPVPEAPIAAAPVAAAPVAATSVPFFEAIGWFVFSFVV